MHAHRRHPLTVAVSALAAGVLFAGACTHGHATATGQSGRPAGTATPSLPPASPLSSTDVLDDPIVAVVRAVSPAVVNVTNSTIEQNAGGGIQPGKGVGTGFVIRSDGVIVTNFHVVEGALNLKVTLPARAARLTRPGSSAATRSMTLPS